VRDGRPAQGGLRHGSPKKTRNERLLALHPRNPFLRAASAWYDQCRGQRGFATREGMESRWLRQLMVRVARCWQWHALAQQILFQYSSPRDGEDRWEVWAYPALQEVLGGRHDGATGWAGFDFNVPRFLGQFHAEKIRLSTATKRRPSELVFEGTFRDK